MRIRTRIADRIERAASSRTWRTRDTILLVLVIITLYYLPGCAMTPAKIAEHMDGVAMQCHARHETFYQRAQCISDGRTKLTRENNYPHIDLVVLINATQLSLGEKIDKGEITKTQANLALAELVQRIATEELRRNENAAYAEAAQFQTIMAGARLGAEIGRQFDPPPVHNVNIHCIGC